MEGWTAAAAARLRMLARELATQDELVERTRIPKATLQRILAGKTPPGDDRFRRIVEALGIEASQVLKGGETSGSTSVEVPIVDIQVSAGPGRYALDEDQAIGSWPFPRDWLASYFGSVESLRIVRVLGDSQEPELRDGDPVLIDLASSILSDGMHVVRLDDALLIKRIQVEGGKVRLKSANPSYDDIIVDLAGDQERFRVVARAVGAVKRL